MVQQQQREEEVGQEQGGQECGEEVTEVEANTMYIAVWDALGFRCGLVHLATRGRRLAARLGAIRVLQKGRTSRRNGMGRGGTGLLYCTSGT